MAKWQKLNVGIENTLSLKLYYHLIHLQNAHV